ncbi:amino acid adenylation domain-containing protein [Nocardia sp. NPDC058176]|uniref:amino acid adenylation domain-containing protein n=1 Tax=Nocardia sp. NPDC058176 TaxID=3346368 RepID=UPI0036DA2A49
MSTPERSRISDIMPLTPLQQGLLFVSGLGTEVDVYTVQATIEITGPLDGERLRAAAHAVLERHPNLRACFRTRKTGEPVAIVPSRVEIPWRTVDLTGIEESALEPRWSAILDADRAERFDPAKPPLLRFTLATLGPDRFRLLLTNHHLLLDGWSSPLFVRELFALYPDPDPGALPAVRPFRDFLRWLDERDHDAAVTAWRTALADVPGPTLLAPTGATRNAVRPQRHTLPLSAETGVRLGERARELGVTVNSIVSAVWGLTLGQAVDSADVLFGSTVSGRSPEIEGVESMIGMFLGTSVVRIRQEASDDLAEVIRRAHQAQTATMDHQHLGLPAIQQASGHGELFDTLLVFESYPDAREAMAAVTRAAGLSIESVQPRDSTHYPLTVTVILEPTLTVHLFFHDTVFTDAEIATLSRHFTTLLTLVAEQPKTPLAELALCTEDELAELTRWGTGPARTTRPADIEAVITARTDDAVAIRCDGIDWTYAQLAESTAGLAAELRRRGIGPEDRVVAALPRGFAFATALLAILRTGATYVPVDLGYPRERIDYILADATPTLVIGDMDTTVARLGSTELSALGAPLPSSAEPAALGAPAEPAARSGETVAQPQAVDPNHPAYLVYTSGSTGRPKGVLGTRAALNGRIDWAVHSWGAGEPDIRLSKSSFAFIDGTTELLAGLAAGALVVIATDTQLRDVPALAALIEAERITQLTAVPTLAAELIAHAPALRERVGTWILSGERTNPALLEQLHTADNRIINSYGSSEIAGDVTWQEMAGADVAIGRPVPEVELEVLDRFLRPVAPGAVGELYVRGEQVARGYHGNPAATAARFVAAPSGQRRYATGDLVRWRRDGVLDYLGRADQQVKIRGNRVEPGEVDAALAALPGVEGSATVAVADGTGAMMLRSFVVGAELDAGALRRALAQRLPSYLVPAVEIIAEIPRLPGGKVDKRALSARSGSAHASRAANTELETRLTAIIGEVLGLDDYGVEDDFFARGGHSLLAARVAIRVQTELGQTVSVRDLFEHPTVAELAAGLASETLTTVTLPPIVPVEHGPTVALSHAQHRLWAVEQIAGAAGAYNLPFVLELHGRVEVNSLTAALSDLVDRHAALRTLLVDIDGEPAQRVLPRGQRVPFTELTVPDATPADAQHPGTHRDLATEHTDRPEPEHASHGGLDTAAEQPGAQKDQRGYRSSLGAATEHRDAPAAQSPAATASRGGVDAAMAEVERLGAQPFRLDTELPIRAALVHTGSGTALLLVCLHHVAGDEWSTPILFRDLAIAYRSRVLGFVPAWSALPLSYADYATCQRSTGEALAPHREFWSNALAGAPEELALPYDRPRPEQPDFAGAVVDFTIDTVRAQALAELGRSVGATGFMVVHALVATLLAKLSGGRDIVVGTPVSGRTGAGVEEIVGLFTNTVALRTDLSGDLDFTELLRRIRAQDLAAFEHQDLPFDVMVELAGQDRVTGRTPLFQTMVQYRKPITAPDFAGLRAEIRHPEIRSAKFDLTFDFLEQAAGQGISARIEYATALFDRATVATVAERLLQLVDAVTTDPGIGLRALSVLEPAEREQLRRWNDTTAPFDAALDLPALIADSFRDHPEQTALVFGDRELSYRELDRAVAVLAAELDARGVGVDDIVAVALDRSFALLVAVLAVHRVGAAYLPVDRGYPADRIEYMLTDARPSVLIDDRPQAAPEGITGLLVDENGAPAVPVAAGREFAPCVLPATRAAYVIYTSGSTGKPKGVVVAHDAIVNRLRWMQREYGLVPGERVLHKTPISFDVSVWELFWPLTVGATIVLAAPDGHRDPAYLADLIRRTGITTVHFVPSMLGAFLAEPTLGELPRLRRVLCSGEALTPALRDRCHELLTVELHNLYGPTEAAVDVTATEVPAGDSPIVAIGAPVWNTRIHVLDRDLAPVPVGGYGDIYLAGVQLARGYLHRPALTADRFVANPFAADGSRLYRTGDIGRWNTAGQVEYAGRSDFQVKIRGQRIELGEIDAALHAVDGVDRAATLVHTYDDGRHNLVGYAVTELTPRAVIDALARTLPAHMLPAAVIVVEDLPVTANGKLDRTALAKLVPAQEESAGEPLTERETLVAQAIAEVVRTADVETLGPDSDFFALGGDSIVALSLVGKLRKRGLELSARAVFEHRTVRALAAAATEAGTLADDDSVGPVPLTPIVSKLVQRTGPSTRLNQTVVVRLPAGTETARVERVIAALVARHDALRLQSTRVGGQVWTLHTRSAATVDATALLDTVTLPPDAPIPAALDELADTAASRLDPEAGVLVRFTHVDRGAGEPGYLVIVAHHLVVDGASWRILLDDLDQAAHDRELDPVPVSLRSYADAVTAQAAQRLAELTHWRTVLAPGANLVATGDHPGTVAELAHLDIEVGDEIATAITAPARPIPTTDLLVAALRLAVSRWRAGAGVPDGDLTVDVERHGRDGFGDLDLTRTVGWLTNVTPVRLPASDDPDSVVLTTAAAMAAAPDGGIGFGMLRYANPRTARVLAALPRPQVLFNYLGRVEFGAAADWRPAPEARTVSAAADAELSVEYPLEINVRAEASGDQVLLRARFTYLPGAIRHNDVALLAELWAQALPDATDLTKTDRSG